MAYVYGEQDSFNAGQAKTDSNGRTTFRSIMSSPTRNRLLQVGIVAGFINFLFLAWLINPHHIAAHTSFLAETLTILCFMLIVITELIRMVQALTCWFFAYNAVTPVPVSAPPGGRIAIITEINTGKETSEQFLQRLETMQAVKYNGTVDIWVLDEDDDATVKQITRSVGVHHFSRKHTAKLRTDSGQFKRDTAYGNVNAWRSLHEHNYDIVANINPDDWLTPVFFERTLGYFLDQNVAFVTIPHVYGTQDSWLARAAAAQKFLFHGTLQRGANNFGSPVLSSASHLYRVSAWQQIGGYQAGELSDNLTGMLVHASYNQYTNRKWRGIYTPDVVAIGQGPVSWQEFFDMQSLWAYGTWKLILTHARRLDRKLAPAQSLYYAAVQYIVPGITAIWLVGNIVSVLFFIFGLNVMHVSDTAWVLYWVFTLGSEAYLFQWLNRFNLNDYEREQSGLNGVVLTLISLPNYVAAALHTFIGHPPITSSNEKASPLHAFQLHLKWGAVIGGVLVFGLINFGRLSGMMLWSLFALSVTALPAFIVWYQTWRSKTNEIHSLHVSRS